MRRRIGWSLLVAAACATSLPAQVVRGRVTEVNSSTPVVGALVSLLGETGDSSIVSVLTTPTGDYAIRAPGAGTYRLAVKRIGVQRFVTVTFALGSGETRGIDVPIAAVAMSLPEVNVSGLCVTRPTELGRIASLWDEARTALEATEISLRDRLMVAKISRYAAELDPGNLRVLFDWRTDAQVMTQQPFTSMSGDSLSAVGYWRRLPGDSVEYLAPDASALASNAFIRDHCFSLATRRSRPGLVGLSFVPASDRVLPDISGTIWLDARAFELRLVEFRYTRLPPMAYGYRVGGEVHFARLSTGAWIVDRWFIRMPQVIANSESLEPRPQLFEEGGTVITEGGQTSTRPGTVVGVVRDSTGRRPIGGAVVRAIGTHRQVLTDDKGAYRLDSLPPGSLALAVHTDGYDSFAVLAGRYRLNVQAGSVHRVDLFAPNSAGIRRETCPDPDLRFIQRALTRGALRLLMVDSATSVPMPGIRFLVSWPATSDIGGGKTGEERYRQAVTDSRGVATFCDLPHGFPVEVSLVGVDDSRSYVMMVELKATGITGRVVTGRIQR